MGNYIPFSEWILGFILILSSIGILWVEKPVYASLSFLMTLLTLAAFYMELSSEFIAAMQVLIYAGAILVIFMFVIVLFQDAHQQLAKYPPQAKKALLTFSAISLLMTTSFLIPKILSPFPFPENTQDGFGSIASIGKALYLDYFFPFESVIWLFLIAIVGALYIAKKEA